MTFQIDPNGTAVDGYRLFIRKSGQSYNYNEPVWTGLQTGFTVEGLEAGVTYYFVVRSYVDDLESGDSNEVSFTTQPSAATEPDNDGDGMVDYLDAFPSDPAEWKDSDNDGIGNHADQDDDNDGMPDWWELKYGMDPLLDDADKDSDGDGMTNLTEYQAGSDPLNDDNRVPLKPVLHQPADGAVLGLSPRLVVGDFIDPDGDLHARTRYQLSTFQDFSSLTLEAVSEQHLTDYQVQDLILDPDTVYYWRACFYDNRHGRSEWSQTRSFTTINYCQAGDCDGDGVLDFQEVDRNSDLDGDGTPDAGQADMLCVAADDPINPLVCIKSLEVGAHVVSARALNVNGLGLTAADQPDLLTGLIAFKLYLDPGISTARVAVFLSEAALDDALWYKYDSESGWIVYPDAVFGTDRKSVTLVLKDGGNGDQDGVVNGVIVDPSGMGYSRMSGSDVNSHQSSPWELNGCFIANLRTTAQEGHHVLFVIILSVAKLGVFFLISYRALMSLLGN